ncbi:MAG: copper chaperone PCu(A)C [Proteobacteria bacterium]|jgi:copper(I)-binding protein|nr:copper chaperone PCu(A)C [Pseudomonadota bacterium]MDA1301714.1 copper chaperone PCu(A)C [Pseudomonadota bacterium]
MMSKMVLLALLWSLTWAAAAESAALERAWARATPPGVTTAAIYGVLTNRGDRDVVVVSMASSVAKTTMLHATRIEDGMMRMAHEERVSIAPGQQIVMQPGGRHLMLMGLVRPLIEGEEVEVIFNLESGASVSGLARVGRISQTGYIDD